MLYLLEACQMSNLPKNKPQAIDLTGELRLSLHSFGSVSALIKCTHAFCPCGNFYIIRMIKELHKPALPFFYLLCAVSGAQILHCNSICKSLLLSSTGHAPSVSCSLWPNSIQIHNSMMLCLLYG